MSKAPLIAEEAPKCFTVTVPESRICGRCKQRPCRTALVGGPQRLCLECHAANMREWRRSHELSEADRKKDSVRSFVSVYLSRGKISRKPCQVCGELKVEALHMDYSKPLDVVWLCRLHHVQVTCGVIQVSRAA